MSSQAGLGYNLHRLQVIVRSISISVVMNGLKLQGALSLQTPLFCLSGRSLEGLVCVCEQETPSVPRVCSNKLPPRVQWSGQSTKHQRNQLIG